MCQALAVRLVVDNIVIGRTQRGQICVQSPGVLIFDVLDQTAVLTISITVHQKHNGQVLILCPLTGLFSFNVGRHVGVICNILKNCLHLVGVGPDITDQSFGIHN